MQDPRLSWAFPARAVLEVGAPGQEEVQSSSTFGAIYWGAVGRDVGNRISTLCENGESKAELLAGGLFIYLLLFFFFFDIMKTPRYFGHGLYFIALGQGGIFF